MKKLLLLIACAAMFVGCEKQNPKVEHPAIDNKPSLTVNILKDIIGVNQKLWFNIQAQDKANVSIKVYARDDQGWSTQMQPDVFYSPTKSGERTLIFTAIGSTNDSTVVTKKINVTECDFMFGRWGDTKDDIIKYEDGTKDGGFTGNWLNYTYGEIFKKDRSYYFTDDKILSKGKTSVIYSVSASDPAFAVKILLLTDAWKNQIKELTNVYGAPISNTFPAEFDSWSQTKQIQYIQTDITKTKAIFKNSRSEVIVQISNYGGSNLGFNTETTYSKL